MPNKSILVLDRPGLMFFGVNAFDSDWFSMVGIL